MPGKSFFITTAIDYVNRPPHLGTAYEKVAADVVARYKRLEGLDTHFLMGNDEHSLNVERRARELKMAPLDYCDMMAGEFEATWHDLGISYDDFIRTTEARHIHAVQEMLRRVHQAGDISQGVYEGWYCVSCERFYPAKELVEGNCPTHSLPPEWIREENHFFRLSRYRDPLRQHVRDHPEFIRPEARRNEILSFLDEGLEDISISRSSTHWGVPLPFDDTQVAYVWFDALINYLSGVGFATNERKLKRYWPADLHVIGKDITRFHCVIWPAMLLSAGLPLPACVFGHGFVNIEGEKISKTRGTDIHPRELVKEYGADPLRYFLIREIPFGRDGDFSEGRLIERYNADLANGLGNLVSRVLMMIERYQGGVVIRPPDGGAGGPLAAAARECLAAYRRAMEDYDLQGAVVALWGFLRRGDGYVEENAPWEMAKDPSRKEELAAVLHNLAEALRWVAILVQPVMPERAARIWRQIGAEGDFGGVTLKALEEWGGLPDRVRIERGEPLFPRIERKR